MNKCLNCEKEYNSTRDTSKFCSTNCRVKFHRKNGGKKKEVNPIQVQALFNAMMEMVDKMGGKIVAVAPPPNGYDAPKVEYTYQDEMPLTVQQKSFLTMSPSKWTERRRECETADDFEQWKKDVNNDLNLTVRDRNLVLQTV